VATPDAEYSRVVLHEFGHAIGCIHEHSSPAGGIKWHKEVVYRDLGGPPNNWDKATVDHNVFAVYDKSVTQFTAVDSKSIMLYSFPKEWTLDGMTFTTNGTLSSTDKKFIKARYPKSGK
jgi:serralysin